MKKAVSSVLLASSILTTAALATNGDNLIGAGPVSRGMGGSGIGLPVETDSIFTNPAWISEYDGSNNDSAIFSFGGTIFQPNVKARVQMPMYLDTNGDGSGDFMTSVSRKAKSRADMFMIPEIALLKKAGKHLTFGVGAFGVSGMGADYRDIRPEAFSQVNTAFQYLSFIPAFSFETDGFHAGLGLNIAYGALAIGAVQCQQNMDGSINVPTCQQRGSGLSTSIGTGILFGLGYKIMDMLYLGFNYKSQVDMEYKNVFDFNLDGNYDNLELDQPVEYGFGVGVDLGIVRFVADWKKIKWSEADGYSDFGWEDQDVYSLGAEATFGRLKVRLGYNNGNSPIKNKLLKDSDALPGSANGNLGSDYGMSQFGVSYFNLLGFPAISEEHYTIGLGYKITGGFSLDFAYTYSPANKITHESDPANTMLRNVKITASNEQSAFTAALRYNF